VIISSRSQARRPACTHGSNAGTYWTLSLSDRRMSVRFGYFSFERSRLRQMSCDTKIEDEIEKQCETKNLNLNQHLHR